jgi:hypothetical protein
MVVRFKMADQNRIFWHNFESIFFQSSFSIHLVLVRRKFCRNKDGGLNGFFYCSRHLVFFWKICFYKICVLPTPNECKKKIEKMLDALKVMPKNPISVRHFGSNHHFWLIWQNMHLIHVADKNTNAL